MASDNDNLSAGSSREWNWHPDLPVAVTPLFCWPPRPIATLRWFAMNWLPITEYLIYALMAWATWAFLQPGLEEMTTLKAGWVLQVWLRNLILMTLFAMGLHLWLYRWRKQEDQLKFDRRGIARDNRVFAFNDQLWDNVFFTLVSGVSVWTVYECAMWMAFANGWVGLITIDSNPIWFFALFLLMPVIQSFHFYWVHRLLHWPPLYKRFHSVHHRNVSIGPWSGFSMHPGEHIIYLSLLFVFLLIPSHPVHLIFMAYWLGLATATSHSGYESILLGEKAHLKIGSFHHQLHHRFFECNYGNPEMPWDNWFGSYHDGNPETTKVIRERKRQMHS